MSNRPIAFIEALKTFASLLVAWVVLMGIWPMTPEQQALTISLAVAGINLVGAYFQNRQTTPLADPKDEDGTPLVRPNGTPTYRAMANYRKERAAQYRGK